MVWRLLAAFTKTKVLMNEDTRYFKSIQDLLKEAVNSKEFKE